MMEFLLIIVLMSVFVIGVFVGFLSGRVYRGLHENTGEGLIRKLLTQAFRGSNYHLLNNVTLDIDGETTQIDHILVSTSGVFVIETKHYTGWIFGKGQSKKWTQVVYKKKTQFQNPIHQNYKHLRAVQQLLDFLPDESICSLVVFTGDAVFKTERPNSVFNPSELVEYIKSQPQDTMSINRMSFCVGRLECMRYQLSRETDFEHQSRLSKKYGET